MVTTIFQAEIQQNLAVQQNVIHAQQDSSGQIVAVLAKERVKIAQACKWVTISALTAGLKMLAHSQFASTELTHITFQVQVTWMENALWHFVKQIVKTVNTKQTVEMSLQENVWTALHHQMESTSCQMGA
jgi:hypothetical protein